MIRFCISALLCLVSISVDAQVVTQFSSRWEDGIAQNIQIVNDRDGNSIIAGYHYTPSLGGGGGSTAPVNTFIQKYDENGVSQWIIQSNSTQSSNSIEFGSMDVDTLGNIYVLASFVGVTVSFGSASYSGNQTGGLDFFIMKITPNGTIAWITGADAANSFQSMRLGGQVTVTPNQELLVSGALYRELRLGSIVLPGNPNVPYLNNPYPPCGFIARMSNSGSFLWAKQIEHLVSGESNGGNGIGKIVENEWGEYFALASLDSGFVIDGTTIISSDTAGIADLTAIVKLNAAGNLEGYKIIKSPFGSALDLVLDKCGEPIVLGEFQTSVSVDTFTISTLSARDAFVTKFDRDLNCQWLKGYGSTEGDVVRGLAINRLNEVFFSFEFWGTINMSDVYTPAPSTVVDVAVVKLDVDGDFVWSMHTEGGGYGTIGDVSISQGDIPYWIGNFRNSKNIQGNTVTSLNNNHSDIFICIINDTTVGDGSISCVGDGVGVNELDLSNQFAVYPNPAKTFFVLEVPAENDHDNFQLITTTGAVIKAFRVSEMTNNIDVTDVANGVYFIRHSESGQIKKIIIE